MSLGVCAPEALGASSLRALQRGGRVPEILRGRLPKALGGELPKAKGKYLRPFGWWPCRKIPSSTSLPPTKIDTLNPGGDPTVIRVNP